VPTLREVQAAFAHGILDPSRANLVADGIVAAGIAPERRLAVYRNNVLLSLRRVLEGTFPASRRLLGPERFAKVARAFISSAPPRRPQLMTYGAGFPAFLARSAEARIADVAKLEWAREEAYYAVDAAPLSAPIAAADLLLLESLGQGRPLAEAAAVAQAADAGFDLQTALALHLAGGSFAGCG
jgi:hypothetical protein